MQVTKIATDDFLDFISDSVLEAKRAPNFAENRQQFRGTANSSVDEILDHGRGVVGADLNHWTKAAPALTKHETFLAAVATASTMSNDDGFDLFLTSFVSKSMESAKREARGI